MPRTRLEKRRLYPAVITDDLLRRIDKCIPEHLRVYINWYVNLGRQLVSDSDMESLLSDIKKETRFVEVHLEVLDDDDTDHALELWCEKKQSQVSYAIPTTRDSHFLGMADDIEALFKENRRGMRWLRRSTEFRLGSAPKPLLLNLNWTKITEDMLSRLVAHAITLGIGIVVGYGLSWFLGRGSG